MHSTVTARHIIIALFGVALVGVALNGIAHAVVDTAFTYSKPKIGYLMVPAAAFTATSNTVVYASDTVSLDTTGGGCFMAPADLPQGAKMTMLSMWYQKNDTDAAPLTFERVDPSNFGAFAIAELLAANTANAIKSRAINITDPSLQIVDNSKFAYVLRLCVSDTEAVSSVRIKYTYTSAGD
jgi:hypothetical protein